MDSKLQFQKKLAGIVALAKEKGNVLTVGEIERYFAEDSLTAEQIELVYDYLLSQKVAVKGYVKMGAAPKDKEEAPYTAEEKEYLDEYERELSKMKPQTEAETYLADVLAIAKEMRRQDIFIGDMVQEGNMSLLLALESLSESGKTKEAVLSRVRQGIQMLIEEQAEARSRDRKMVQKVEMLNEAVKKLTEDLGRKVSAEELAVHMELTVEEVYDILRLMGEESDEENEEE